MSLKEYVVQEMETLGEKELQAVAEYVSFLKFRSRTASDKARLAALYNEIKSDDRAPTQSGAARTTLALFAQWEQEDAQMTPEKQADNARIYTEIEREGIPRVRF